MRALSTAIEQQTLKTVTLHRRGRPAARPVPPGAATDAATAAIYQKRMWGEGEGTRISLLCERAL